MQRSTTFLTALFVVAVAASAAIKFRYFSKTSLEPVGSVQTEAAQTGRGVQAGPGRSTGDLLPATQRTPEDNGSAGEASPSSGGAASVRPWLGSAMRQDDLETRATRDSSIIVRYKAVQGLSDFASSDSVQTLANVLRTDQAMRVRLAAVESLVDIARDNPGLVAEVQAALQAVAEDSNNNVSVASRQAISEIQGVSSLPAS